MSKTGKIVLGCAGALVLSATCLGLGTMYGAFKLFSWGKSRVEEATGGLEKLRQMQEQTEQFQRQANAQAFSAPADGRLREDRLLKFLSVRRDVYGVYEQNRAFFEVHRKDQQPSLADVGKLAQLVGEIRLAQARAQAREGLGDDEYRFMVEQVYKGAVSAAVTGDQGETVSEHVGAGLDQAQAELRKQLENPELPPEARKTLEEQLDRMREAGQQAREVTRGLDVPAENVALIKKHEDEIKKYAMNGLALIGL